MLVELSSLVLPGSLGIFRRLPPRVKVVNDDFLLRYDTKTLFYDCFFDPLARRVKIYAPSLLNFRALLEGGLIEFDGIRISDLRISRNRCFDRIEIPFERSPSELKFSFSDFSAKIPVRSPCRRMFSGRRVLCTISKDNDPSWIRDWVRYHKFVHGVDSILFIDNGSQSYALEELEANLISVLGSKRVAVVNAPLPYGPASGASKGLGRSMFFQTAMLNLAVDRFFSEASGVLSVDIDELVVSRDGGSVFDALDESWFGFLKFNGYWRYPQASSFPTHAEHKWVGVDDPACPSKYCYQPGRGFGRFSLGVHGLLNISRRLFPASRNFYFAHCRQITNGWKRSATSLPPIAMSDAALVGNLYKAGLLVSS